MASTNDKQLKPESSSNRRKGASFLYIGTIALLVITVVAFVFVPAMGSMGSRGELTFGTLNGKPISFVQGGYFSDQVKQVKAQYESQGYRDTGDQFFVYQVWRRAFENTAVHMYLLDSAKRVGMAVSDSYIDGAILENQIFMENGAFSKRKYREASATMKLALRKNIEVDTLKNRYLSDSVSFIPSKAEVDFLKSIARSRRVVEYVAIPFSSYPEAELLAYAKAHPESFRRVRLSKVTISSSQKDAGQVLAKVKNGSLSFEEAAKNHSKDSYGAKGGDMGSRFIWELKDELSNSSDLDAVLALARGEVSAVYGTLSGAWSFYRVDEPSVEPDYTSAELVKSVSNYLNRNEKGRIEDWAVATASSFASAARPDFAAAARARGYAVKETQPFPLNYGNALDIGYFSLLGSLETENLPELRGADTSEGFLSAAFSLQAGEVSSPVVLNDQALVLRVKEIKTMEDQELALLEAYYRTVLQQGVSNELATSILASPSLKDDFINAFSRVYSQAN